MDLFAKFPPKNLINLSGDLGIELILPSFRARVLKILKSERVLDLGNPGESFLGISRCCSYLLLDRQLPSTKCGNRGPLVEINLLIN